MRVLLVEDDLRLGDTTRRSLSRLGLSVDHFETTEDGWHAWKIAPYDVVILDAGLAREPRSDLLARARAAGRSTPVLLLTPTANVGDRVRGLNAGADDCLIKPFDIEELLARLRALARRPRALADQTLRQGDVVYHVASRALAVGGARASLSRGESLVLEAFLRAPGRVISKAQLGERLHSMEQDYTDNSIQVHVHRVRRKLADLGATLSIRALRGLGYIALIEPKPDRASGCAQVHARQAPPAASETRPA